MMIRQAGDDEGRGRVGVDLHFHFHCSCNCACRQRCDSPQHAGRITLSGKCRPTPENIKFIQLCFSQSSWKDHTVRTPWLFTFSIFQCEGASTSVEDKANLPFSRRPASFSTYPQTFGNSKRVIVSLPLWASRPSPVSEELLTCVNVILTIRMALQTLSDRLLNPTPYPTN